jgi:hypothetical protein
MTIDEAYSIVAQLAYKESHRNYKPKHGLLVFDRRGQVVSVEMYKRIPSEAQQDEHLSKHPRCLQIFTKPHWFGSPADLQARINEDLWIFKQMKNE